MPQTIEAGQDARGLRFCIVASRYHETACESLLSSALATLQERGALVTDITVVRVPGSWEIPLAARRVALSGQHDAVVALGVLIRGETAHFDLIAGEVARGLATASFESGVPIAFGVIAAGNVEQVLARSGGAFGNRGHEAALAAIEAAGVMKRLEAV